MSDVSPFSNSDQFTEAAIFGRVVAQTEPLSKEAAEAILALDISDKDQARVDELLAKNRAGSISAEEREELNNLNHIANLVSIWHSRARIVLNSS